MQVQLHHPNDPEQMQQWVENVPLLSRKSPKRTRSKRWRSGSRTK